MTAKGGARVAVIALVGLALHGCATIVHGTRQDVLITSLPSGATAFVDGVMFGRTPVRAWVSRESSHDVVLQRDGFDTFGCALIRRPSRLLMLDLLLIHPIIVVPALGADYLMGGFFTLEPKRIAVVMRSPINASVTSLSQISLASSARQPGSVDDARAHLSPRWWELGAMATALTAVIGLIFGSLR